QGPVLRPLFDLLLEFRYQLLGCMVYPPTAPPSGIAPQVLTCVWVHHSHDRKINRDRPFIGTIACDIVAKIWICREQEYQVGLITAVHDLEASPELQFLKSSPLSDGHTSRTLADNQGRLCLHDS